MGALHPSRGRQPGPVGQKQSRTPHPMPVLQPQVVPFIRPSWLTKASKASVYILDSIRVPKILRLLGHLETISTGVTRAFPAASAYWKW